MCSHQKSCFEDESNGKTVRKRTQNEVKSKFELLELACLAVADGDLEKLQDVVDLEPPAVKIVEVAMLQQPSSHPSILRNESDI